ncbi:ABC transporter permease [Bifidobacterium sp. ESL0763]|uniref:ABC transporter permease n=1 Tax=Bifidobacterium sp. ESL0763 TaxID=2983227 RepID=UPI0023F83208|nr:ABC transporter permease [Bifidobacterium sp. ESL0763]MDF7663176.1 ABC transporter permease [Bifidobacterium sp. ESL0763]
MLALSQRNLRLFFRNHAHAFLSLLGALIAFGLYVVFLRQTVSGSWGGSGLDAGTVNTLLDNWLMGGVLSITGLTTPLAMMGQMVGDRENGLDVDFRMALHSRWRIVAGYLLSSVIVGFAMQIVVFAVMLAYFVPVDRISVPLGDPATDLGLLAMMALNATVSSVLSYAIVAGIRSQSANTALNTLIGTAAGFLAGVYLPVSAMPEFARRLIQLWPGAYTSSLFRRLLMDGAMDSAFAAPLPHAGAVATRFRGDMGIGYTLPHASQPTSAPEEIALLVTTTVLIAVAIWAARMLARSVSALGFHRHRAVTAAIRVDKTSAASAR